MPSPRRRSRPRRSRHRSRPGLATGSDGSTCNTRARRRRSVRSWRGTDGSRQTHRPRSGTAAATTRATARRRRPCRTRRRCHPRIRPVRLPTETFHSNPATCAFGPVPSYSNVSGCVGSKVVVGAVKRNAAPAPATYAEPSAPSAVALDALKCAWATIERDVELGRDRLTLTHAERPDCRRAPERLADRAGRGRKAVRAPHQRATARDDEQHDREREHPQISHVPPGNQVGRDPSGRVPAQHFAWCSRQRLGIEAAHERLRRDRAVALVDPLFEQVDRRVVSHREAH